MQKTFQKVLTTPLLSGREYRRDMNIFWKHLYPLLRSLTIWMTVLKWYSSMEQAKTPEYLDELAGGRKRCWNIFEGQELIRGKTAKTLGYHCNCLYWKQIEEVQMKKKKTQKITTTIQGHKVVLIFTDKANPCVTEQIKQTLLNTYTKPIKVA